MNYEKEEARPGNGRSRFADGERENNMPDIVIRI